MAVAAYGSLLCLVNVLDNVHYRAEMRGLHVDIKLIESLQEGVNCLVDYAEHHSQTKEVEDLWRQLSKVAFEAEQMFDFHLVNQLQLRSQGEKADLGFSAFNEDVETMIHKFDFIQKELSEIQEVPEDVVTGNQQQQQPPPRIVASAGGKSAMVGFDEHLYHILDRLASDEPNLQVIPIVGMGGIGKTTLARNAFDNQLIVERFDIRIWVTISQEYNVNEILLRLLNDEEDHVKSYSGDFDGLGEKVHKRLFGRRYLIVMDDVWDIEIWNWLTMYFPNTSNGSRVMMTTRLADLATSLGCQCPYFVTLLNEVESWNLICQTMFAQEGCPYPELEEIGKSVVRSCRGLPLAIVVMGSHLANSEMTKEYWQFVAENMSSFGNIGEYEHCIKVLYLSYNNLPIHLKLCFLYTRVFKEDAEIEATDLIGRWIAEGFIKPAGGKHLEEIAGKYIKDLVARNLMDTAGSKNNETCRIHDLLRDLSLRESEKEQFIHSPKVQVFELESRYCEAKDVCFHCGRFSQDVKVINLFEFAVASPSTSEVCCSVCKACEMMYRNLTKPRVVKVAYLVKPRVGDVEGFFKDADELGGYDPREELAQPTQLRCAYVLESSFLRFVSPSMLSLLWNLQTLVFRGFFKRSIVLPSEIWEMPQLRRIDVDKAVEGVVLPDPLDTHDVGEDFVILKNMWSLPRLLKFKCTKEMFDRIPNMKVLSVRYNDEMEEATKSSLQNSLCNLIHLQKLESLTITDAALEHIIFPNSLKQLVLQSCKIPWKDMSGIGSLPNLEELSLSRSGEGLEWTPIEGEFLELKKLSIHSSHLESWNADQIHFPKLEELTLYGLRLLNEIPLGIGDIATLRIIKVLRCSTSAKESAKKILEEQQSMENESLRVEIH